MKLKYYKCNDLAKEPIYGTKNSAGFDLYSTDDATILPGQTVVLHTGIIMEIPEGYFGAIYPRSGIAIKHGLRLANSVGVIDSDYRGEIMIPLYNDSKEFKYIRIGDRIAQMVIQKYTSIEFELHDMKELDTNTERSTGGFGSNGRN